ncbi:hypothetical protein [Rhizobium arsenicireducens]|jgi:two-component SAPR family response regulator
MHNPSLRVLVAENQYLIAMEVEQILLDAIACTTTIIPSARLQDHLRDNAFDLVLLDCVRTQALNLSRARLVQESGAALIFLSSYDEGTAELCGDASYPLVQKPIQAEDLIRAVQAVTARTSA